MHVLWPHPRQLNLLAAALALAALTACGGGGKPPKPPGTPTPGPTIAPTPPALPPLTIQGNRFFSRGVPFDMKAIVFCCTEDSGTFGGWPVISEKALREIKRLGGNFAHIRLGPHAVGLEGTLNSAYLPTSDGRVNLDKWNPAFDAHVEAMLKLALELGIYVEVDLLDGWTRRTHNSAYDKKNNINGVDDSGVDALRRPLKPREIAFVEKYAAMVARFPNTTIQDGNETWLTKPTEAWEQSFIKTIRRVAPKVLIGSNTNMPWAVGLADYQTFHATSPASPRSKPTVVNETRDESVSPQAFCTSYKQAKAVGSYFMMWRGLMSMAQVQEAAKCWNEPTLPPGDDILWDGPLPRLKCAVFPEPQGISCICTKPGGSGPCPGGAQENAASRVISDALKAARPSFDGVGAGGAIVNGPAYMVSILRTAQAKGWCAKFAAFDEVWVKTPGASESTGYDVIHHPSTGGAFVRDAHLAVRCTPAGL